MRKKKVERLEMKILMRNLRKVEVEEGPEEYEPVNEKILKSVGDLGDWTREKIVVCHGSYIDIVWVCRNIMSKPRVRGCVSRI